mgnify:CR=1 FL=1
MSKIVTNKVGTFYRKDFASLEDLFKKEPNIIYQVLEKGFNIIDSRIMVKDGTIEDDLYALYNELKGKNPSATYSRNRYELIIKLEIPKK